MRTITGIALTCLLVLYGSIISQTILIHTKTTKEREVYILRKTNVLEYENKLAVDINELQNMLSVGKQSAAKIGEEAKAVIRIGRRKLYNVSKINDYLNKISEV